jgi:tetratricopeptide (TPR) repeat protein
MPGGAGDGALSMYYSQAERDSVRALALAENMRRALPNDAESYNYLGVAFGGAGRTQEAVDCFVRAEEINPQVANYPRNLVLLYSVLRRAQECRAAADRYERLGAKEDSPGRQALAFAAFTTMGELPSDLTGLVARDKALWLQRAGRFEPMLAEVDAALVGGVSDTPERLILLRLKCDALKQLGRNSEAEVIARDAVALATKLQNTPEIGPTEKPGWLAQAYSRAGRIDEAIAAVRRYVDATSPATQIRERWRRETVAAELYAYAKRPRECVEQLAKLLRVPSGLTVPMLKVDPAWDNVREDAAFKALLADPKNSAPL